MASQSGQVHNCRPAGRTAHWLRRRGGLYIAGFTKHGWQSEPHRPGKNGVCKRWDTLLFRTTLTASIAALRTGLCATETAIILAGQQWFAARQHYLQLTRGL